MPDWTPEYEARLEADAERAMAQLRQIMGLPEPEPVEPLARTPKVYEECEKCGRRIWEERLDEHEARCHPNLEWLWEMTKLGAYGVAVLVGGLLALVIIMAGVASVLGQPF